MESLWFIAVVSVCISSLLVSLFNLFFSTTKKKLPPGPQTVPVIGSFLWLRKSFSELEPILRNLRYKYGPLVTLWIGSRPAIFVGSHTLAHIALVQKGAVFSDRPKALPAAQFINSNQHNISSAFYGPIWRLLRRNLTSEILHPSRVKTYSRARKWVLTILIQRLLLNSSSSSSSSQVVVVSSDSDNKKEKKKEEDDDDQKVKVKVKVVDHFQYAMFCLLVLMCFGDKLDENQIKSIETVQRDLLLSFGRFNILNFWPRVGKVVFRNRWKELIQLRLNQEAVLIPLITSRIQLVKQRKQREEEGKADYQYPHPPFIAYVDTLVDLELPDDDDDDDEEEEEEKKKRKLDTGEMVSLCSEFLNGGTDTTSTTLQWIMANLVKYPGVQAKLYEDICGVMGPPPPTTALMSTIKKQKQEEEEEEEEEEEMVAIKEEDLHRMKYLKAVVLEGLRRHPPGHFVLPHSVSKEVELDGYVVPKNATVNFMVAEMGWDPKVWDEPMEFKPERFLFSASSDHADQEEEGVFDISGSREIKMMPFGAGRRICPASGLALLHLEYFVANLVWYFEWGAGDDAADVDLSEKQEFTVVMKNPLRAHISPRLIS